MKQKISIVLILALGLLVALPSAGYSWRHYGHHRYYHHGYYNGWGTAAIIAGSVITGALIVSAINQSAQPYYPQQVVYVNPAPVAYYPPVNQPYAAPDPAFVAQYNKKNPSGEWITVPGQQIGDKWVPSHKVHVPSNP
ncbi:MAG: hypothetical protein C0399_01675 [Syntrophus sp. (in: bacteria)]|nr:hypothetical protein [Syntrophus sp. (in: bacteria)]